MEDSLETEEEQRSQEIELDLDTQGPSVGQEAEGGQLK